MGMIQSAFNQALISAAGVRIGGTIVKGAEREEELQQRQEEAIAQQEEINAYEIQMQHYRAGQGVHPMSNDFYGPPQMLNKDDWFGEMPENMPGYVSPEQAAAMSSSDSYTEKTAVKKQQNDDTTQRIQMLKQLRAEGVITSNAQLKKMIYKTKTGGKDE